MTPSDQISTSAARNPHGSAKMGRGSSQNTALTFAQITLRSNNFRSTVPQRPDPGFHPPPFFKFPPKSQVGNLDIDPLVEEDVLKLQISVDDALAVKMRDAQYELPKDTPRFMEGQPTLLDEVVEELSARAEFRDEVNGRFRRDDLVEGQDVGVSKSAVMVDFSS